MPWSSAARFIFCVSLLRFSVCSAVAVDLHGRPRFVVWSLCVLWMKSFPGPYNVQHLALEIIGVANEFGEFYERQLWCVFHLGCAAIFAWCVPVGRAGDESLHTSSRWSTPSGSKRQVRCNRVIASSSAVESTAYVLQRRVAVVMHKKHHSQNCIAQKQRCARAANSSTCSTTNKLLCSYDMSCKERSATRFAG